MTDVELLDEIDTAISAVLKGQRYEIAGREWEGANLNELRQFRREVQLRISRAASEGGIRISIPRYS